MNVSSSKVSDLLQCTMSFYLKHVLMLPDRTHWKTLVGSALHNVVEYCLKPKRRALLDAILEKGFSFAAHPSLDRYCRMWRDKHRINLWDHANVEAMLQLTFITLRPYLREGEFKSEQRFEMKQPGGEVISGYLDIDAHGVDKRILDMKTKGKRFPKVELEQNVQAAIYQLYRYVTYGELVPVTFIMTRFPPTKRDPSRHLQTVEAPTPTQLEGMRQYLVHLYHVMNRFTKAQADTHYHDDPGFCERVCPFYAPFKYLSVKKRGTDELVANYLLDTASHSVDPEHYTEVLPFKGCAKWNPQ